MTVSFKNESQSRLFQSVVSELRGVGYRQELVEEDYHFRDWFARDVPIRTVRTAFFGRRPTDYDSVLFGIEPSGDLYGAAFVNRYRALGAPVFLEVGEDRVSIWTVGADEEETTRTDDLSAEGFRQWVQRHRTKLTPEEFLRSKNIKETGPTFYERRLFTGLIPLLEEQVASALDPRLTSAFRAGWRTYEATTGNAPSENRIFKVAFWLLTGKVFADRMHPLFRDLHFLATPERVLHRVAAHHSATYSSLLNSETREAIFSHIWSEDFRHLSVDALSQIWSRTLVTSETRRRLGIHRTRRSLVRYIIDRIPFDAFAPEDRHILEPCSGSAGFLVAAMERLRDMPDAPDESDLHTYFRRHLTGFERDLFGAEISQLCLSLADYPHKNGWSIKNGSEGDVFKSPSFPVALERARVVLCNPPFRAFTDAERKQYGAELSTPPGELLNRVLQHLHPEGVLGFVVPLAFLNGKQYIPVRTALAKRYANLDILRLPDKGWGEAMPETALVIGTKPNLALDRVFVSYSRVREQDWTAFDRRQEVRLPSDHACKAITESSTSLGGFILRDVWDYLAYCPKLGSIAKVSKGIEWNVPQKTHRDELVQSTEFPHSKLGVPPEAKPFRAFETPPVAWLSFDPKYQRRPESFKRLWGSAKIILNKSAKSRGPWRLAAFPDLKGLACYETFVAVWPKDQSRILPLAAVLNNPIANAFIWEQSGKREAALRTIREIPIPILKCPQLAELDRLVLAYLAAVEEAFDTFGSDFRKADRLLREMDALILDAYGLPPRLQRRLLDMFNGDERQVPFKFADYFPKEFEPYFRLSEWLTGRPQQSTIDHFRSTNRELPDHILAALAIEDDDRDEE